MSVGRATVLYQNLSRFFGNIPQLFLTRGFANIAAGMLAVATF